MSALTARQRRAWEEEGWCVLERALPVDDLAGARKALTRLFPSAQEMAAGASASRPAAELDRWRTWDAAWPEFPFHSRSLNAIVVGDAVLDLATVMLGTEDVRLYLAIVSAKYAGQSSEYNQLLHTDFPNHTLTVPRPEPGYHQMETFIYLNDVDSGNGATRFLSRRRTRAIPVEQHTLGYEEFGPLYDDPSDASAPAGSIVAYRPDVYHRSVDFADPSRARFMLHVSYKTAGMDWGGYQAWPFRGFSAEWHRFVEKATPRQLGVLGFPAPGHPFWTPGTLEGVGRRYPGLDLAPWREALGTGDAGRQESASNRNGRDGSSRAGSSRYDDQS